jgi:peptidyl-prolyl cis-trans isomerase A (cyclophilin A)
MRSPKPIPPLVLSLAIAATGCQSGPVPEPEPDPARAAAPTEPVWREPTTKTVKRSIGGTGGAASADPAPGAAGGKPVASVPVTPGDPTGGSFTLEDATQGLPKGDRLVAEIRTTKGKLACELWPDKAPITVANFVGLARGIRPWKQGDTWVKKPLYDGTPFHRVVKGFMIQGGDPAGTGAGGPGYVIPDEIWEGARHDQPGLLCMANRGANTNGSQFFVMDGAAAHLDGGYTIFGKCSPTSLVTEIASVPARGDKAIDPVKIDKVVIRR